MQQGKALPVYVGRYNIRGYGLGGSIISNLFKTALPFLKPIAKKIMGRVNDEAIRTGRDIAQDVFVDKISPKSSIKNRTKESFKRVFIGKGRQFTTGCKGSKKRPMTLKDIFQAQGSKARKRKAKQDTRTAKKRKLT